MRISENTINQIREQLDIVEIVSNYLVLKRTGVNYRALCPFHTEKTPSFFVSPSKQIFHCFGCGKGGDLIKFVSEIEGINYYEAAIKLAKEYNIPVEYEGDNEYLNLLEINRLAGEFFHKKLLNYRKSEKIKNFLKKRGIDENLIERFYLGYADEENSLLEYFINRGIDLKLVEKLGLIKSKDGKRYDTFRNRIIFPIRNIRGDIIAFGGRVLNDNDLPKYLNSQESPIYNKSRSLYGIFENKDIIKRENEAIFVEGYMDLVSLYKEGVKNCVASLGTALTEGQINLIRRIADNILFFYDGDKAGIKASIRGSILCINKNLIPKIISLPDGIDPDDFIKERKIEGFLELKKNSLDLVEFIYEKIKHLDLAQINIKLKVVKKIQEIYMDIENPFYRDHFIKKFSQIFNISENELKRYFKKYSRGYRKIILENENINRKTEYKLTVEDKFTAFLIQNIEDKYLEKFDCFDYLESPFNRKVIQKVLKTKSFLSIEDDEEFSEEEKGRFRVYLNYDLGIKSLDEKEAFFYDSLKKLKGRYYKNLIERLTKELKELELNGNYDNEEYNRKLIQIENLKKEASQIWS